MHEEYLQYINDIAYDNIEGVKKYLEIHGMEDGRNNMLISVCEDNRIELARVLIYYGADIHVGREMPFFKACGNGNLDMVKLLISNGADVNKRKVLAYLSQDGHLKVLEYLLCFTNIDIHQDNEECFLEAVYQDKIEMVWLYLEFGADVHARNDSALLDARNNPDPEMLDLLMEYS
jgi:ankyrin repeat protein